MIIADAVSRNWQEQNAYLKILPELIYHARRNGTVLSIGLPIAPPTYSTHATRPSLPRSTVKSSWQKA